MDINQNQDGLDGLPLEAWMNQQPLMSVHPSLSSHIYQQPIGAQSMQDFLTPRVLQSFSAADHRSHIGQPLLAVPSSGVQQYSLSSSAHHHQSEHQHERSAWSHLLSIDPSVTAMGSHMNEAQESLRHVLPGDVPYVHNTRQDPLLMLKGNTKLTTSFDNKSHPKVHFSLASGSTASIPFDNYPQMPVVNASHNKSSQQFVQTMNSTVNRPSVPKSLAISNDVSSLESSGSYSPVSPPATETDQQIMPSSSQSPGRVADLFLRESHEITPSFPLFSSSDQTDFFYYLSEKTDPFSSDLNMQDSYSEPPKHVSASNLLPSPSDVPLDMTTAFGSKVVKESDTKESSEIGANIASSDSRDKSLSLQSLLTKDQTYQKDSFSENNATAPLSERNQSHLMFPATNDEKMTKQIKCTPKPKKSNFYGRDASLFSFIPPSSFDNEPQVSMHHPQDSVGTDLIDNKNFSNSASEVSTVYVKEHENIAEENNTILSAGKNLPSGSNASTNHAELVISSTDLVANVSTYIANSPVLRCSMSQPDSEDTLAHSFSVKEPNFKDSDNIDENEDSKNYNSQNSIFKSALNSSCDPMISNAKNIEKHYSEESVDQQNKILDIPSLSNDDFFVTTNPNKIKTPKRKKRKATGFQTKPRKRPVRKQLSVQQPDAIFNDIMNVENNDSNENMNELNTELSEPQNYENASFSSLPVKRKTRKVSKAKASGTDLTPRRSSSRKSKDNAMRLIELQADANYSGISQPVDVPDKKSTRKRKMLRPSFTSAASDDLSEFSDEDSTEEDKNDDSDKDYMFDDEDTEPLDDDVLEQQTDKKINKEKKVGGLKISIKLSGNASAEIVSGIKDSPVKKKKKAVKKKGTKNKRKEKLKTLKKQDEADVAQEVQPEENLQEPMNSEISDKLEEAGNSTDTKDRHMSLMEKYFSAANSAKVVKKKKTVSGTESAGRKKPADNTKSKLNKNAQSGVLGVKKQNEQKNSVKFLEESAAKKDKAEKGMAQEDGEAGVPKFVCGYCPQKYHNKQDLLAHMEAHMVEMERKTATESVDESTKPQDATVNLPQSKSPKSSRIGTSVLKSAKSATSENSTERGKPKPAGDQDSRQSHSVQQKFHCGECGQVFNSKPSLLDHVRIHTAEKPFECDICHKCFTERNFLSDHRKTHTQEKLLRCHMCSKAFVYKADLHLHMQSHPKRSNTKLSNAHGLTLKKPFKKDDKHEEVDSLRTKKPKSFASALTGEVEASEKSIDASSVLVLKRGDGPPAEAKNITINTGNKTVLNEPKVTSKPVMSVSQKASVVKTNSSLKKHTESPVVSMSVKGDNNMDNKNDKGDDHKINNKNNKEEYSKIDHKSNSDVEGSLKVKTSEAAAPDICTCKECPDCVTRFLQSFE